MEGGREGLGKGLGKGWGGGWGGVGKGWGRLGFLYFTNLVWKTPVNVPWSNIWRVCSQFWLSAILPRKTKLQKPCLENLVNVLPRIANKQNYEQTGISENYCKSAAFRAMLRVVQTSWRGASLEIWGLLRPRRLLRTSGRLLGNSPLKPLKLPTSLKKPKIS